MESNHVNAKSVLKSQSVPTSKVSFIQSPSSNHFFLLLLFIIQLSLFLGSAKSSSESEKELILSSDDNIDTVKEHNFIQEITVFPEVCEKCHKKFVKKSFIYILIICEKNL